MEESTNIIVRFFTSHAGLGPTVKPQIAELHFLVQKKGISWENYPNRVASLVTEKSTYGRIMHFYRMQAIGWGLTILVAILH